MEAQHIEGKRGSYYKKVQRKSQRNEDFTRNGNALKAMWGGEEQQRRDVAVARGECPNGWVLSMMPLALGNVGPSLRGGDRSPLSGGASSCSKPAVLGGERCSLRKDHRPQSYRLATTLVQMCETRKVVTGGFTSRRIFAFCCCARASPVATLVAVETAFSLVCMSRFPGAICIVYEEVPLLWQLSCLFASLQFQLLFLWV